MYIYIVCDKEIINNSSFTTQPPQAGDSSSPQARLKGKQASRHLPSPGKAKESTDKIGRLTVTWSKTLLERFSQETINQDLGT